MNLKINVRGQYLLEWLRASRVPKHVRQDFLKGCL